MSKWFKNINSNMNYSLIIRLNLIPFFIYDRVCICVSNRLNKHKATIRENFYESIMLIKSQKYFSELSLTNKSSSGANQTRVINIMSLLSTDYNNNNIIIVV